MKYTKPIIRKNSIMATGACADGTAATLGFGYDGPGIFCNDGSSPANAVGQRTPPGCMNGNKDGNGGAMPNQGTGWTICTTGNGFGNTITGGGGGCCNGPGAL
jgi:hypothetical protein